MAAALRTTPPTTASPRWLRGLLFGSNAGTFLQITAQAWLVWERTHDAAMLGVRGLVQATPLLGGLLADRFLRRAVLLVTQATLAAVAALTGVLALTNHLGVPLVLLLAGVLAAVAALDNPVRQVYLPGVVVVAEHTRVVGRKALAYSAGAAVGPALAGLLLPRAGAGWCFLVNAASYLGRLALLGWLLPGPAGRPERSRRGGMAEALSYLRRAPEARRFLLLVAAVSLLGRSYVHVFAALVNGA